MSCQFGIRSDDGRLPRFSQSKVSKPGLPGNAEADADPRNMNTDSSIYKHSGHSSAKGTPPAQIVCGMMSLRLSRELPLTKSEEGFLLVENLIALAIFLIFFVALFTVNSQGLYLLNSGREAIVANVCLRDRIEQLRDCPWAQLTDSNYLRISVLSSAPNGASNLGQLTETLTINSYPVAIHPPITVVRSNGSASVIWTNPTIVNGSLVRVDDTLSWTAGPGGRSRTQATSTLMGKYQ